MPDEATRSAENLTNSVADAAATTGGADPLSATGPPPASAGRYELGEEIAHGGMGVVYRATDTVLGREVAVKVLAEKFASGSAAARRFADEARITGQLQHPAIPPVHDLGTLPDGRPFLAMKLIKGETLEDLLADRSNPFHDRGRFLAVFEQVCQAVAYAHAHKVIHRDLKPSNVMVGAFGEVQVMDWGLAKLTTADRGQPLVPDDDIVPGTPIDHDREDGGATRAGSVLGTPAYMSPEQARGEWGQVGPPSDVFGLGAILAVVLTGAPPYGGDGFLRAVRRAGNADLGECFTRLNACGAEPELVALARRCLAPEKADRPADAGEVARSVADLRAAADERARRAELDRVRAEAETREQRKRRRVVQWACGAVAAVLLAGVAGTTFGMIRAGRAADAESLRAEGERVAKVNAEIQREQAVAAREQTQKSLVQLQRGNQILTSVFAELDIKKARRGDKPLERVLGDRLVLAAAQLEGEVVGDPLTVAELQIRLGQSLSNLGFPGEAVPLFVKARATRTALLGGDHSDTLNSMNDLAEAYRETGALDLALPLLEETLKLKKAKLGPDDPSTITSMNNLAGGYHRAGKHDRALSLFKETLEIRKARLGADHPDTVVCMSNLGEVYRVVGRPDLSVPLLEEARRLTTAGPDADQPSTLTTANNLALAYRELGDTTRALPLFEETLRLQKAKLGADHPDTLATMQNLALVYSDTGRTDLALPLLEQTLAERKKKPGVDPQLIAFSMFNLAGAYAMTGRGDAAVPLFEDFTLEWKKSAGTDGLEFADLLVRFAGALIDGGQFDPAEKYARESLRIFAREKPEALSTYYTRSLLGAALLGQRKYEEAEPLLIAAYTRLQGAGKTLSPRARQVIPDVAERLAALYTATGNRTEAERWRAERRTYGPHIAPPPREVKR